MTFENTGTEPLVTLRYFGPDVNPRRAERRGSQEASRRVEPASLAELRADTPASSTHNHTTRNHTMNKKLSIGTWAYIFNQEKPTNDFHEILHKLQDLGYEGVELGSFGPHPTPVSHPTKAEPRRS